MLRVWDGGVRGFHWALVGAVAAAALTGFVLGRTVLARHLAAGSVIAALIVWRIVWGTFGPAYARFASFAGRRLPCWRICTTSARAAGTGISGTIRWAP